MPIRPPVQKIIGDKLVTDRQQTTDRQTDRQTDNRQSDIFELTPIHMGNLIFFCILEGESEWGEIYTSLLRSQGDKPENDSIFILHIIFVQAGIIFWIKLAQIKQVDTQFKLS
jgi:hypothetical protein